MSAEMVTSLGEKHGLINTLANSVPDRGFDHFVKEDTKKKAEALRKEEAKIVKAKYINKNGSHERLTKPYMRWSGDPIQIYHLIPGQIYDLPYGFVKEINDPNKKMKIRSQILDINGRPTLNDQEGEALHQLLPVGF
jgi:hypothetical protein